MDVELKKKCQERWITGRSIAEWIHSLGQSSFLPFFGSMLSGLLLALSFPGFSKASLAYIGLVPILFSIRNVSAKKAMLLSFLAGAVFFLVSLFWLHNLAGKVEGGWIKCSAWLGYILLSLYCALYFIPAVLTVWICVKRWGLNSWWANLRLMFLVSMVWVSAEYLRSFLFTGFLWNPLGVSQYASPPLIQIAQWGGVYLVSACIVWMNMAVFITLNQYIQGVRKRKFRVHIELMLGFFPVAFSFAYGVNVSNNRSLISDTVSVALIQPNVAQVEKWDSKMDQDIRMNLTELTEMAARFSSLDLIIWPETAVPDFLRVSPSSQALVRHVVGMGVPLLVGSMDVKFSEVENLYFNSAILFETNGVEVAKYDKQHLVPFGEYVPFPKLMGKFTPIDGNFRGGTQSTLLPLRDKAPFSVLICFEDIVAPLSVNAVRNGARWLVNQTNDAWFDPSAQSEQHLAHAVFRCVENRIPMVRSCNTGVSSVIDAYGHVVRRLAPRTSGFITAEIHPRSSSLPQTFYTRYPDAFAKFSLLVLVTLIVFFRFKRARKTEK